MDARIAQHESLLLQSLDAPVSPADQLVLTTAMQDDFVLRRNYDQYLRIREALKRKEPDSFGPFFAERVMHVIGQRKQEFEYVVLFFFKKYQLLVVGIVVALLIANLMLSDQFSLPGIFGLKKPTDDDVFSTDQFTILPE
jgi:hypothetical protein